MYDEFAKEFKEDIEKRTMTKAIAKIMLDFKVPFEKALKILDIPEDDYDDYTALLNYFYPDVMKT